MLSFKISAAVIATALFSAQAQYTINPDSVPLATRTSWCQSQLSSCPLLCLQLPGNSSTTEVNYCDPTTLTYSCICGNGLQPNASEYSETLPYFICTEYDTQCVAACGDAACASACRDDNPCGAQNPPRVNTTSTSSTQTATATATTSGAVYTGLGGATSTSASTKSGSQGPLDLGRGYGLAFVFTGIFVGFAWIM